MYRVVAVPRRCSTIRGEASYAAPLLSHLDGVVVLLQRGTPRHEVVALGERLRLLGVPIVGILFSRLSSKTLDALDVGLQSAAVTDPLQPEPHDVSPADIDADQTAGGAADIDTEPVAQVVPLVVPSAMQGTSPDYVSLAKLIPPDVRQKARAGDRDETDRTPTNAKVPASKHTAGTAARHPR